ncbi:flagellin [Salipaludibacillus agaradhaerens]|uniref:Flagellin n=1 Tax=Salipaludibacillus agaradhaerens TaxID=76935 RepID=A0A9Q4B1J6_SALAG|nr:flagellin [Salipaludibacillus agaradhaerens]MCR6096629.1 flagellin [Salipaludibacillus agaradhaerens]MCR6113812.1 flagellin [Salipaludibacillus agaradhaerens]
MKINNNIQALNAYRNLNQNQFQTSKNLEKLSSGLRINRASDDAAGLAISEKMRSQIRGLKQAERNAMDGISLIQTAEGALTEVHSILQRMRELAVQAANDTYELEDRETIQQEIDELVNEINSIAEKTEFNTKDLLNGDEGTGDPFLTLVFQIGANAGQSVDIEIPKMNATELGLADDDGDITLSVTTREDASEAIETLSNAINAVSNARAKMGALQNRMEHTINNLQVTHENLTSAESRIRDADMALEMTEFTRNNILNQSATAMLAQANQLPQGILQLLQ